MIRVPTKEQVLRLHQRLLKTSGGGDGLRDEGLLESAMAQSSMTFGGNDLYPTFIEKVAATGYSLIMNHPFVDGNKRIGHATMEVMLAMNGQCINADVDDAEAMILGIAAGEISREALVLWLESHVAPRRNRKSRDD